MGCGFSEENGMGGEERARYRMEVDGGRGDRIEWEKMWWERMVRGGRERGQNGVRVWDVKRDDGIGWKRMKGG